MRISVRPPRSRLLRAAMTTSGTAMLAAAVAFLVNILMARQLGPESRGFVAWGLQWAYVVAPLLTLGVDRDALRGLRTPPGRVSAAHVWVLGLLGVAAALVVGSFAATAAVATAAIGAAIAIERGTGMAKGSLKSFVWLQIGVQTWILAASITLYIAKSNNQDLWLAVYAAPAPVLLAISIRSEFKDRHRTLRERISPTWRSMYYMLGGLGTILASRVERLILPTLASPRQLGLYVSVATASEMLVWAARGLGESRVATFVEHGPSRSALARIAARDLSIFMLIAVPLGLAINFALLPLLGAGFIEARLLIAPLCVSSALWATYLQMSAAWLATGSGAQSMRLDLAAAGLTAVAAMIAVPQFGALGAAVGCAISYALMIIIAIVLLPRSDSRTEMMHA